MDRSIFQPPRNKNMGLPAELRLAMNQWMPKLNHDVCMGLSHVHMKGAANRIHEIFTLVAERYPAGLKYEGMRPCTPEECYHVTTRRSGSDRTHDIAPTDAVIMVVHHSFNGIALQPRYLAYCDVRPAGVTTISASSIHVKPVMCDKVISVTWGSIFAKLSKIKLTFQRRLHHFCTNQPQQSRQAAQVVWSHIFNSKTNKARATDSAPKTPLVIYLFSKYGVTETFRLFLNTDVKIGVDPQYLKNNKRTSVYGLSAMTDESHPPEEWVVYSSTGLKLRKRKNDRATPMRLAVRKSQRTTQVDAYVGAFYYVLDHFPDYDVQFQCDDVQTWRLFLGYILRGADAMTGKLANEMETHVSSIETYLDQYVINELRKIGYNCKDFYQFLALVVANYEKWILDKDKRGNTPVGKVFDVIHYVLYDVIAGINNASFALTSLGPNPTMREIEEVFAATIRHTVIFDLTKGGHGEIETHAISGDCFGQKHAMEICPQTASGGRKQSKTPAGDPDSVLHAHWVRVHQIEATSKSNPVGTTRANQFVTTLADGTIYIESEEKKLLDWAQKYLTERL